MYIGLKALFGMLIKKYLNNIDISTIFTYVC